MNQQVAMVLKHSICKQRKAKYQHMNCSSCMIYVDELFPFAQFRFPKHRVLDQRPVKIKSTYLGLPLQSCYVFFRRGTLIPSIFKCTFFYTFAKILRSNIIRIDIRRDKEMTFLLLLFYILLARWPRKAKD